VADREINAEGLKTADALADGAPRHSSARRGTPLRRPGDAPGSRSQRLPRPFGGRSASGPVFGTSLPGPIHERDCTAPLGSVTVRSVRCGLVDFPSNRRKLAVRRGGSHVEEAERAAVSMGEGDRSSLGLTRATISKEIVRLQAEY